jgi:hypothetical protein
MIQFLVAFPLIMHGLANLAGVFAPWTAGGQGFTDAAWIFPGRVMFRSAAGRAFGLLWLASTAGLIAAGAGVFLRQPWWSLAAIVGCALSAAAILTWVRAVPPGARFGAAFDILVILALLSPLEAILVRAVE